MFKKLFSTDLAVMLDGASSNQGRGLDALRTAFSDWRFGNDVAAIVVALERLSNHRLHMIGLRREGLIYAVRDMMLSAEEDRAIGREVIAILDASEETAFSCPDTSPPDEYPRQTETVVKKIFT
jgi:hypothetical protein